MPLLTMSQIFRWNEEGDLEIWQLTSNSFKADLLQAAETVKGYDK